MKTLLLAALVFASFTAQARLMLPACEERVNCNERTNMQISRYRDLIYDALQNDREKMNLESDKFKAMGEGDRHLMTSFKADVGLSKSVRFIDDVIQGSCNCNDTVDFMSKTLGQIQDLTKK